MRLSFHNFEKKYFTHTKSFDLYFSLFLFVLAFVVRYVYTVQIQTLPSFKVLVMDAANFDNLARQILQDGWIGKELFFIDPFYQYFLALIYKIFGTTFFAVRLTQIILSSLTCVFHYFIAKKIIDRNIGIASSLVSVFYGVYVFFVPMLLKPSLFLFLETLSILLLIIGIKDKKNRPLFLSGLTIGLMMITRGNTLIILLFLFIWMIGVLKNHGVKTIVAKISIYLLGISVILIPFATRNYIVSRQIVITSTCGGFNFYIGNNKTACGLYSPLVDGNQTPFYEKKHMKLVAEQKLGRKLTYNQASDFWFSESIKWIINNKLDFIKLILTKIQIYFNHYEIPDAEDFYIYQNHSSMLRFCFITFAIIASLAIAGMIFGMRDPRKLSLLYFLFISNSISVVLFFIFSRFRVPVVPWLIIFAVHFVRQMYRAIKTRRFAAIGIGFLSFLIFYLFVNSEIEVLKGLSGSSYFALGDSYRKTGQYDKAISEYQKGLRINPYYDKVYNNLAGIYLEKGQYDTAVNLLKKAIRINPLHLSAQLNLAKILMGQEDYDTAKTILEELLKNVPNQPDATELMNKLKQLEQ